MRDFAEKIRDRRDPNWRVRRFDRRWRIVSRAVLLAMFLLLVACENPLAIESPERFTPDPDWGWRALHESVEACVGIEGDYDEIEWYRAETITWEDGSRTGAWQPPHRIYLVYRGDSRMGEVVHPWGHNLIMHEIVHDLLQSAGHDHPAYNECVPDYWAS